MERKEIIEELEKGICELIVVDKDSVEDVISATLSSNHLPEMKEGFNISSDKYNVMLWNLAKEEWQMHPVNFIIGVERLTGYGVKNNEQKLSEDCINSIGNIIYENTENT